MQPTSLLRQAAAQRTPLIKFIGKRSTPSAIDHTPKLHPASPTSSLPDSFAAYRSKAQQHGPLNHSGSARFVVYGAIGGKPGRALGPVEPKTGEFFDRTQLPERFGRLKWTEAEIEAVETGGASMFA